MISSGQYKNSDQNKKKMEVVSLILSAGKGSRMKDFKGNKTLLPLVPGVSRFEGSNPILLQILNNLPPRCDKCNGILKPDFVFFGEPIPEEASNRSFQETEIADLFLVIGTTGEIQPASTIPVLAHQNRAKIIEINVKQSNFTNTIVDIFLHGTATDVMDKLLAYF